MFDGIFINHLVKELKMIENVRINKVNSITDSEIFLNLSSRNKLIISINSNSLHIRLTSMELVSSSTKSNFHQTLKKYLESSIINKISQYNLDRIIVIDINYYDELGYLIPIKLIIELFGRNSNIILTHDDNTIIDCYKRCLDDGSDNRIILPKSIYSYPASDKINPYACINKNLNSLNNYEGVSSLLYNQFVYDNSLKILNSTTLPTIFSNESNKHYFYAFDLPYLYEGSKRMTFESLSQMLEYFYCEIKKDISLNNEQIFVTNYITKEIKKIEEKIAKQRNELLDAKDNLHCEKIGNLLASNLYRVKKGDSEIIVDDFYNNNTEYKIVLNPLLTPQKNLNAIFHKYQKAKRAIEQIENQINLSIKDNEYYHCLLNQLSIAKATDVTEIIKELDIKNNQTKHNYLKNNLRKSKPNITTLYSSNDIIYIGKNNMQNNYITHTIANKDDYFFHVQKVPGSHVILKTNNLTDELLTAVASICAYFSSARNSTNVCIDYTLIKNVKKVPGMKGSFVTYSNYKSVIVKPDSSYMSKFKTNPKN